MTLDAYYDFLHTAADAVKSFIHTLPFADQQVTGSTDSFVCGFHEGLDAGAQYPNDPATAQTVAVNQAVQVCQ
ncbi:hypothetical protein [Corynebacterium heidelbergense]|uniref:Uncharacterized protein n=1 Tax=Corynebacterium heidelbergense TaxID=2055947 RepID=A0A364V5E2_9CORY|nr:hypothetical protein [Corynebacterium heidelbergense]RAV31852.1 hypothetical protein DLJ54_06280 [Corynebacterium heidelbergense]